MRNTKEISLFPFLDNASIKCLLPDSVYLELVRSGRFDQNVLMQHVSIRNPGWCYCNDF